MKTEAQRFIALFVLAILMVLSFKRPEPRTDDEREDGIEHRMRE